MLENPTECLCKDLAFQSKRDDGPIMPNPNTLGAIGLGLLRNISKEKVVTKIE